MISDVHRRPKVRIAIVSVLAALAGVLAATLMTSGAGAQAPSYTTSTSSTTGNPLPLPRIKFTLRFDRATLGTKLRFAVRCRNDLCKIILHSTLVVIKRTN